MNLPAETTFPICSGCDLTAYWNSQTHVTFESWEGCSVAKSSIDREQVESLRDQLNQWLEVAK